jgi:hypothetical protein
MIVSKRHCRPEALHRPEPIKFGAPQGVQGEGRGHLIFAADCFGAALLAMTGYSWRLYWF